MASIKRDVVYSTVVNANDQGGIVKIVTALCTVCIWLFFGARIMVRWPLDELFGKDDYVTTAATVTSLAQQILVNIAVSRGLGRRPDLPSHAWISTDVLIYASDLMYIVTTWTAKLAIAVFFLRLTCSRRDTIFVSTLLVSGSLLAVSALLLIASQEHGYRPWAVSGQGHGRELARSWAAVEVMGGLYELGLILFPIYLVTGLRMRAGTRAKVIFAFLLRLPILALSVLRVASLWRAFQSNEFLYDYATTEIFTQVEMMFTVISATVVCLRIFLMAARSGIQTVPGFTEISETRRRYMTKSTWLSKPKGYSKKWSSAKTSTTATSTLADAFDMGLCSRGYGETITEAARNDSLSVCSQATESAIVVRQTVDVTIDRDHSAPLDAGRTGHLSRYTDV